MHNPPMTAKLTIELVPRPLWGKSLYNDLTQDDVCVVAVEGAPYISAIWVSRSELCGPRQGTLSRQ